MNSILASVRQPVTAPGGTIAAKPRPLVLLRGSLSDADSLVLTEEDHEDLLENILRMPSTTATVARQTGASVVFLGVSPRDPLVRALARQLLETSSRRKHGPTFFVCPQPSPVDEAYWSRYAVEWISDPMEDVIGMLNALALG